MDNEIINVNFYGEKKTLKLNEKFDSFKLDLSSLLGINEEKLNLLNIFYKDEDNDNICINNSEDYKQLLIQIQNNLKTTLEIEVKSNYEKSNNFYKEKNNLISNSNKNNFNNINIIKEINFEIKNIINKEINYYKNENEIIYPISCSLCKEHNLKNVIYFCSKCKNYICSSCFEKIKMKHSHSFNIIVNLIQFKDINENTIFNENENKKNDSSLVQKFVSNIKDSTNNFMNDITNLFKRNNNDNNNNINNNINNNNINNINSNLNNFNSKISNNNFQQPNIQNNLNYYCMNGEYYQNNINNINYANNLNNNQLDINKKNIIEQFRQNYELSKFTDEQLKNALEKADWNMNNALEKLF